MAPLVFITGASSGIGQSLAQRYLAAGWRLLQVGNGQALRSPFDATVVDQGSPQETRLDAVFVHDGCQLLGG